MSFCKLGVNKKSDDCIESISQNKVGSSLNSERNVKEGVCYFLKSRLPTAEDTVNGRKVEVLRDTGCVCCIVKRSLVSQNQLIGRESYFTFIDETTQRYPLSVIDIDSVFHWKNWAIVYGRYIVWSCEWKFWWIKNFLICHAFQLWLLLCLWLSKAKMQIGN